MYGAENLTMEHTYYCTLPVSVSVWPKKQKRSEDINNKTFKK